MTEVDLDRVEARVDQDARTGAVLLGDRCDVVGGDGLRASHPQRTEDARRREARMLGARGVRHRARVTDLGGDRGTLGVDGVGQLAQARADLRVVEGELMAVGATGARDCAVGDRRHPGATHGHLPVELDEIVGDDALGRAPFEGRRLDDPIAQRHRPEAGGFERGGVRHGRNATARLRLVPAPKA